jgi:hypothetical protein
MGGCAKNGKEGSDGKEDSAMWLGIASLPADARTTLPFRLGEGKKFIRVTLQRAGVITPALRKASQRYWNSLLRTGVADTLIAHPNGTVVVLVAESTAVAKEIMQRDPIIEARGFKSIRYKALGI